MWDVLYAVDASTSMGDQAKTGSGVPFVKIEAVKDGLAQVVNEYPFPFGSQVGVIAFRAPTKALGMMVDSSKDFIQTAVPLAEVATLRGDMAGFKNSLDTIKVGGATPTGEALLRAVDYLDEGPKQARKRIRKLILITDEKSNVGPKPERVYDPSLSRRSMVDVVAIGSGIDRKTFEIITSRTGGKFIQVDAPAEFRAALDPRIPYSTPPPAVPLIEEAERVAAVLKVTDRKGASFAGIAAAADAVRVKMEQKLQDVVSNEGQSRADFDLVVSGATNDPKAPMMTMREYSDRVWSRGAELAKLQALEARYRSALKSLSP